MMPRVFLFDPERPRFPEKIAFHQWSVHVQGECVQVRRKLMYAKAPNTVKRAPIQGLSPASRFRMLRMVSRVDWENNPNHLFITLTYPDECVEKSCQERTRQRFVFHRYMEKHLSREVPVLWRVEWKRRLSGKYKGIPVPHIHLLAYGLGYYDQWLLRDQWRKTIGAGEVLATHVEKVWGTQGAILYVAKYHAKKDALDRGAYVHNSWTHGRAWGLKRPIRFPWSPVRVERVLSAGELDFVWSQACLSNSRYNPAIDGGFTILGKCAADEFAGVLGETC